MDVKVLAGQPKSENSGLGDFAALFAQLAHDDAVAPLDHGMNRMLSSIAQIRRAPPARH